MDHQYFLVVAFLRRLSLAELVKFLGDVYNEERIIVADYEFDGVWYTVFITPDGEFRVDAEWGDGPIWKGQEAPSDHLVRQLHVDWVSTTVQDEKLQALISSSRIQH